MKTIAFFSVLLSLSLVSYAQHRACDTCYMKYIVSVLAHDSLCGRDAGTIYEEKSAFFIAEQFQSLRIPPLVKRNYFQQFTWLDDSIEKQSVNVMAFVNNKTENTILIVAHYDHLGMGGKRSRSYGKTAVHNGADDNASGVAMMLSLARELKKRQYKKSNFLFVALAAHEPGLFGSKYLSENLPVSFEQIKLVVNIDMVGRMNPETNMLLYASNTPAVDSSIIETSVAFADLQLKKTELPVGDHSAFANKQKIPVVFFSTGMHDDYHKHSDDVESINNAGMHNIYFFMKKFLLSFYR